MPQVYGRDFAAVYNDKWAWFGPRVWPFVREQVRRCCPNARTWLDLCCGTGSLLKLVCDAGFDAAGVDASPHQLRYARKTAPAARLLRADVREFTLPERFDVVTCLFDSLNYLTTRRDLERAFRRARRHLAEGGLFIFDLNTYAGLEDRWNYTSARHEPDRLILLETSFDRRPAIGHCLITGFVRRGRLWKRFEEDHVQRGYRPEEVEELLTRVGLAFRKFDGFTAARPRKRSARLVYVCRRR